MPPAPPRLACALLRWLLPADDFEVIAGDLEESLNRPNAAPHGRALGRLWYWRQVASILSSRALRTGEVFARQSRGRLRMGFRQDLSYAMRSFAKAPVFAITTIVMLAIGIGANVAIFALSNAVLLKPLPFADPDRLMIVHLLAPDRDAPGVLRPMIWSYPKYGVFRETQRAFESSAIFGGGNWNLTGTDAPERLSGEFVESTYFDVLGVQPAVGRTFSADETRAPGSQPLAMLGYGVWTRRFGADAAVVGRPVQLNGILHTIVGVLPRGFRGLTGSADVWVPVTTLPAADLEERFDHSYTLVARRKGTVSAEQADADARVSGRTVDARIHDNRLGVSWSATAVPLDDQRVDPIVRRSILLLLAAVGCVLLIVCVNLANLMLFRALARQREVAIRLALGASRLRIIRQHMTESAMLGVSGALGGIVVASVILRVGGSLMPEARVMLAVTATGAARATNGQTAGLTQIALGFVGLDATTLAFALIAAVITTLMFGLGPAWGGSRRDLRSAMKSSSSGSTPHGSRRFSVRNVLVAGEIALALVLLTAAGLMLTSVSRLQSTVLGFNPDAVLTFRVPLAAPRYDARSATQLLEGLLAGVSAHGGVASAAYGSCAPVSGGCNRTTMTRSDRPPLAPGEENPVGVLWASPSYFDTLGIRLIRGRLFTDRDRVGQPKVVVINETAARSYWGGEDPIGKRIAIGQGGFGGEGAEVVGIVQDVRYGSVEASVGSDVYLPLLQSMRSGGFIFLKSQLPASALVPLVRQEVAALDRDLPLVDIKMMAERFGDAIWRTRVSAWLLGIFAALALLLAAVGLYGVMSQGVEQRRRELGVRLALGARGADIMRLILGRVLGLALPGIVIGVLLAVPSMRLLTALLYRVAPTDPLVFSALALILLAVALVAGYIPARRATRVDPMMTLRVE
jgi:putative ABC transport system permease protein